MGASRDDFIKYPRTPHLSGSRGTADDKHLSEAATRRFLCDPSLILEEKLDGTNVGIHFTSTGRMVLQCRGHEIREGMHPQYDLLKQWATSNRSLLESMLADRFILFGEWLHARHSIHYRALPHYFFEFDQYDKEQGRFLDLAARLQRLEPSGLPTVPVVHRGPIRLEAVDSWIGPSAYEAVFENPHSGRSDNLMEGLYLRTEAGEAVTGRAKRVRREFVDKLKQSNHWQQEAMVPNLLAKGVTLWAT